MDSGNAAGPRVCTFSGVAVGDDGATQAYECVVTIARDGAWSLDWHWTTGAVTSVAKHGDGGAVSDLLRSLFLGASTPPGAGATESD